MGKETIKERIREAIKGSNSLEDVKEFLFDVFRKLKKDGDQKIGYVAGIITSEGAENIGRNLKRLAKFTDFVRSQNNFPIFSSTDIFDDELFARLDANGYKNADWEVFFRRVLNGAEQVFVTDIFMTPRWETSHGSIDEYETSKKLGIQIHYLTEEI